MAIIGYLQRERFRSCISNRGLVRNAVLSCVWLSTKYSTVLHTAQQKYRVGEKNWEAINRPIDSGKPGRSRNAGWRVISVVGNYIPREAPRAKKASREGTVST